MWYNIWLHFSTVLNPWQLKVDRVTGQHTTIGSQGNKGAMHLVVILSQAKDSQEIRIRKEAVDNSQGSKGTIKEGTNKE